MERNHLCNIGRRHFGEHVCEIILNTDQCRLKKWYARLDKNYRPGLGITMPPKSKGRLKY